MRSEYNIVFSKNIWYNINEGVCVEKFKIITYVFFLGSVIIALSSFLSKNRIFIKKHPAKNWVFLL